MSTTLSTDENQRLATLEALRILDSPREAVFDDIVDLVARLFRTPIALIVLVDRDRQWIKASHGFGDIRTTPRDISFCTHTIREPRVMVVPDASLDPRFADSPLVTQPPAIRFYAGAPLVTGDGHALGTLCTMDHRPRGLDADQVATLGNLAAIVTALIEARADRRYLVAARTDLVRQEQRLRTITDAVPAVILYVAPDGRFQFANRAFARWVGRSVDDVVGRRRAELLDLDEKSEVMFARALAGETVSFDFVSQRYGERTMHVTFTPDTGPEGVRGIFVVGIDVSARVREEEQRQNAQLRLLNARLHEEIEAERHRIARTLHDECGQAMTAVRLRLAALARAGDGDPALAPRVAEVDAALTQAVQAMQGLVANLRPPLLDDLGLAAAVCHLARQVEALSGIAIDVTVEGDTNEVSDETSTALYRVLQEALTNVQRHAAANEVTVRLVTDARTVRLEVGDDGCGFDATQVAGDHYGLVGVRERARELGGRATVDSRPGAGTRIVVELPRRLA
ncbi:MAG: PAS domain-containing protein [Steroidobacteraceae bacterium]